MTQTSLYIVATPIGNREDMSPRAISVLTTADLLLCEDTRRTGLLLKAYDITSKPRLIPYFDHCEQRLATKLVSSWKGLALRVALVSDAGTPCIADPGYRLVREAHRHGVRVIPIPGPSAVTTLVCASGLPSDRFSFLGFLPRKEEHLRAEARLWRELGGTVLVYEAARRLPRSLEVIASVLANAEVAIGRELTKTHEEVISVAIGDALLWVQSRSPLKGEVALFIHPGSYPQKDEDEKLYELAKQLIDRGFSSKETVDFLKPFLKGSKKDLYSRLVKR